MKWPNQVHSAENRPEFPPFHGTHPSTVGSPDHVKERKGGSEGRPPKRSTSWGLGGAASSSFCGTGGLCTSSVPTAMQAQWSSSSLRLGRTSPSWDTPPCPSSPCISWESHVCDHHLCSLHKDMPPEQQRKAKDLKLPISAKCSKAVKLKQIIFIALKFLHD